MYKKIAAHPNVWEIYKKQLIEDGTMTPEEAKALEAKIWNEMEKSYEISKT